MNKLLFSIPLLASLSVGIITYDVSAEETVLPVSSIKICDFVNSNVTNMLGRSHRWYAYDEYGRMIFSYPDVIDHENNIFSNYVELIAYDGDARTEYRYYYADDYSYMEYLTADSYDAEGHIANYTSYQSEFDSNDYSFSCSYSKDLTYDSETNIATNTDGSSILHFDKNNHPLYTKVLADDGSMYTFSRTYDADGNILTYKRYDADGNISLDLSYDYEKDAQNRVIKTIRLNNLTGDTLPILHDHLEMNQLTSHPFDGYWEAEDGSFILFSLGMDRSIFCRGTHIENGIPLPEQFGFYFMDEDMISFDLDIYDLSSGSFESDSIDNLVPEVKGNELHIFDQVYFKQ